MKVLFLIFNIPINIFIRLKFKNIWGVKFFIQERNRNKLIDKLVLIWYYKKLSRYSSWIGHKSKFSGIPCLPHGFYGIFISEEAILGRNVVIFPHVVIGSNTIKNHPMFGSPIIGNNVYIGSGAKIIGKVVIGDNCRIGANAVVIEDMESNAVAVSSGTKYIQKENLDNRFFSKRGEKWYYFKDGNWFLDSEI